MGIPTGLYGPYRLARNEIDARVSAALGVYALGNQVTENGTALVIRYVGRDDVDVNRRLKDWIGSYEFFLYGHLPTAIANYEKECWLYHTFGGPAGTLDNEIHPAKPKGSFVRCPMNCGA